MTTDQTPTTLEKELSLLKSAFKDNEALLKAMLTLWFGFQTTPAQRQMIEKAFTSPELRLAVRRKMFPSLTPDMPVGEIQDYWIGVDSQILGQTRDTIYQIITSKQRVYDMLEHAMLMLENPELPGPDLTYRPDFVLDELQVNLVARTLYIKTLSTGLSVIKTIAALPDAKPLTPEARRAKESTQ